jgi:small subunit ribosomal protein S3
MEYSKETYLKVIASLIGMIILLILFIDTQPPKIKTVEVIKEVKVAKEKIVEVEKEPTYKYNISSVEREMLARLVYLEANTESLECQRAVASVVIERSTKRTDVKIYTAKPGVIIGHGGEDIEKLRNELKKLVDEEIFVSIIEVKNPDLNAKLVAEQIAQQIEARAPFRSAQKRAIRNTMKAGAKGIKTAVSGRLGGAEMARTEGYTEGTVPLHTIRADIDYAIAEANTTYGKIGVKVWIYKGEILPSKKVVKGETADVNAKKN